MFMVDYCISFSQFLFIDMGIKVVCEVLVCIGIVVIDIGLVVVGNMVLGDVYQYMLLCYIGLYVGVLIIMLVIMVQCICGIGFELICQVGDQIECGYIEIVLIVGSELMMCNLIVVFGYCIGFKLGVLVEFQDYMWEVLVDLVFGIIMLQIVENLVKKYGIICVEVDEYVVYFFECVFKVQVVGFYVGEIVLVVNEIFCLDGYNDCYIKLQGKISEVVIDIYLCLLLVEVLVKLCMFYLDGVQIGGNFLVLVDVVVVIIVVLGDYVCCYDKQLLVCVVVVVVVGVLLEIMGIGLVLVICILFECNGLMVVDIGCFEINEV